MSLKLYNTLTKKKEEFKPIKDKKVKLYTCGPTVYDYAHIGNFRTYVFQDILRRYLEYEGYDVKQVMNITDIDDKTIKRSQEKEIPLEKYTEQYTKAFFEDMETLNIKPADVYPKATETIKEMVELVKKLMEKGFAYKTEDGIYFNIKKFDDYGKLSGLNIEELKEGARVKTQEYDKENAKDFALWKFWKEEDGDNFFETELGKGRPGWHIECSTMSMKNLGETIDMHTGGVDLIFPHHENEIAQSEGATGKQFVKYWLHCEHLLVENKKMSKSLGNFYTLRDLLDKGYDPKAIRYTLMASHYRQQLNFSFEELEAADKTIDRFFEFEDRLRNADGKGTDVSEIIEKTKEKFESEMDDNLNISEALASIFDFMKKINKLMDEGKISRKNAEKLLNTLHNFDSVLGILEMGRKEIGKEKEEKIEELLLEREKARKEKNFEKADEIRDKLEKIGIEVQDTKKGPKWKTK
ncbi:MAG: cysteine--tRNA ligase [Candidatus Undinarchaeales archaeon]